MSVYSSSAPIRVWIGPQTVLTTIPNSAGVWNTAGVKWLPHDSIDIPTHAELVKPQFHTGTGGNLQGILGRKGANAIRGQFPIFPSGAAGTPPDSDLLLQGIMGAAPVVVTGGTPSVTYNPAFAVKPFVLGRFNRIDAASSNQLAWGVIPTRATFNIGGAGYFMVSIEGQACYVLGSDSFSTEDTEGKAGLTAFPAEPTGASATGNIIVPYFGAVTFGGTPVPEFISAQLEYAPNAQVRGDGYTTRYGFAAFPGKAIVTLKSLKFADSNGAALAAVKTAAVTKIPMDVIIPQGNVAGYIVTHAIKNVQFGDCTFTDNGNALDCDFADSEGAVSSYTARDEYKIAFT